ncbi:N2227-domain-containing protein [Laetiporus sulphureus 93-53]|uniref:carnosine N-methyltransferase n=1 Tax=Laetiporus sulphureus 93-53 TaxID=1314785 RepID=A0A165BC44_9APHY|nr:N2227-domain-containing protein [Laetiporus sulphureus 93-53]KZT00712.1 N2227-domain-containing protein [Laetiporus sulphureus 93-53]
MSFTHEEIEEERAHFANVVATFRQYAQYSLFANNRRRKDYYTLPRADQELLDGLGYKAKLAEADRAVLANAEFLNQIVANPDIFGHELDEEERPLEENNEGHAYQDAVLHNHGHSHSLGHSHAHGSHSHSHLHATPSGPQSGQGGGKRYKPTEFDMDKLRSTLKQFVRDWSEEGKPERELCYAPMREALLQHFSGVSQEDRKNLRVLIPGAGLGRLAWDVAYLGFACQGNEFSHYMLLASYFILNRQARIQPSSCQTDEIGQHTLYPYVHSFSNLPNNEAMLRPINIPDVLPSSLPPERDFSLVAGDFEEVYGTGRDDKEPQSGQWDAVMTCFFIDTAKNIVNYLRIIHRILAPGGVWINLGPLLWHFENNSTNDPSVELTLEEVKTLARKIGFEISNERTIDTTYTNNTQSMLGYIYHAAFWTATKIN